MGWIDYKKAYDMIPHSWILECLELLGAAQKVKTLLENSMNGWQTELQTEKVLEVPPSKGASSRVIPYPPPFCSLYDSAVPSSLKG